MEINLSKVPHGFGPQSLESFGELLSKFYISNQKRRKTPLRNKRMIQRQDDKVVVDHMERRPTKTVNKSKGSTLRCNAYASREFESPILQDGRLILFRRAKSPFGVRSLLPVLVT